MNNVDPAGEFFHVFYVRDLTIPSSSTPQVDGVAQRRWITEGVVPRNATIIREGMFLFNEVSVLAHEIGHGYAGLPHLINIDPQTGLPVFDANGEYVSHPDCTGPVSSRNLMCLEVHAGRVVDPQVNQILNNSDDTLDGPLVIRDQCSAFHEIGGIINTVDAH